MRACKVGFYMENITWKWSHGVPYEFIVTFKGHTKK